MSKKPAQLFRAVFVGRFEGAQMDFEAKSLAGAARIAASYELDENGYYACDLVDLLRWDGNRFVGLPRHFVEDASHWTRCQKCIGCKRNRPAKRMTSGMCPKCVERIPRVTVEFLPLDDSEMLPPLIPVFEEQNEAVA